MTFRRRLIQKTKELLAGLTDAQQKQVAKMPKGLSPSQQKIWLAKHGIRPKATSHPIPIGGPQGTTSGRGPLAKHVAGAMAPERNQALREQMLAGLNQVETSPISAPIDKPEAYRWPETLSREDYAAKYGADRDTSEPDIGTPSTDRGLKIIYGPTPLHHEGHLRKDGKVCGHWAMYAYLVGNGPLENLGIQFKSGFRCWYPSKSRNDYHAIVNSESGSYWCWDNGIRPGGVGFVVF